MGDQVSNLEGGKAQRKREYIDDPLHSHSRTLMPRADGGTLLRCTGKRAGRSAYSENGAKHRYYRRSRANCARNHGHEPLGDNSRRSQQYSSHDQVKPLDGFNRCLRPRCEVRERVKRLRHSAYVRSPSPQNTLGTLSESLITETATWRHGMKPRHCSDRCLKMRSRS